MAIPRRGSFWTQDPNGRVMSIDEFVGEARTCPRCGRGVLQPKMNRTTQQTFWGCSDWPGCAFTTPSEIERAAMEFEYNGEFVPKDDGIEARRVAREIQQRIADERDRRAREIVRDEMFRDATGSDLTIKAQSGRGTTGGAVLISGLVPPKIKSPDAYLQPVKVEDLVEDEPVNHVRARVESLDLARDRRPEPAKPAVDLRRFGDLADEIENRPAGAKKRARKP